MHIQNVSVKKATDETTALDALTALLDRTQIFGFSLKGTNDKVLLGGDDA